jgi:hypothetical protein
MRFATKSVPLTKEAHFLDRRSVIGRRMDGSLHVRLFGRDMIALHERVFERDGHRCVDCGWPYAGRSWTYCELVQRGDIHLELSHNIPRGRGGSDTEENTACRCRICHRKRDLHGQPGHF